MSQRERDVLKVMAPVLEGKRTQREAARLLRRSVRQVRRVQRRLEKEKDRGVVHRLRGRPSNSRTSAAVRRQAIELYQRRYMGFGPTMACEKLAAQGLAISAETLRTWLLNTEPPLWQRKRRHDRHRQRRQRRECFGELVQADGSHHDWLEGRGPGLVLVSMIDDATSRLTSRFYPAETTEAYMELLGRYLRQRGRMAAMYVDRDSIFRAEDRHRSDPRPTLTQFKRALNELQIDLILAMSPEAKGRVERSHQTAQDRLVKELRLAGASTIEQANAVLDRTYLPWFRRHCTIRPASGNDAHRPLHQSMCLSAILSIQEHRKVTNDYTIRLDNQLYQILPPALAGLRGGWVTVEKRLDGTLHLRFKDKYLKYKLCACAKASGALPPNPRSLAPGQTPAGAQEEGPAVVVARPSAVRLASGRSGRTPAEPCPPKGQATLTEPQAKRPRPQSKWMENFSFSKRFPKTGHSYFGQHADIPTLA